MTEATEGFKRAKDLIAANLKYNEFKDSTNALGNAADRMFAQSTEELITWLETDGVGSNYNEIVAKAREINADNAVEYKELMSEAITSYLQGQSVLMPGLPQNIEEAKIFLQQKLVANPSDMVAVGITQTIRDYEKTLRGN